MSNLCSCILCKKVQSSRGIHTHYDRTHLKLQKYSSGHNGKYKEKTIINTELYDLNPVRCLNCDTKIVYSKRYNKFCSSSCSAIYSNQHKDYSKFKSGPEPGFKKGSKYPIEKQCKHCSDVFNTYKKDQIFCSKDCGRKYKILKIRETRTAWKNYRADCEFRFNLRDYPDEFNFDLVTQYGWYKPSNKGNNLSGISRDHMVSCRFGFDNNLPAEYIRHPANCRLITHSENSSKNKKNFISYQELIKRIEDWEIRYSL